MPLKALFLVFAKVIVQCITKGIIQFLFFLNLFSYLLWLYSLVCVRPGRKTQIVGFLMGRLIFFCDSVNL